ncbi:MULTISPECIES: 5'-methylthioadenosine/S-adenosylhomocysteine nucleosidase [unclassified Sphingomonas]|uniref:5'-methylthioadenosine/S-adenosylhomocysteine nucleosidase n=1 Tax=unclassified Sphingomonas TaxID=196159 RepID=UPI0006F4C5CB|nr:5'-methylthioadenosine nucleosidase [Sphingomonas sp. Leaf9]KQM42236.1 5'-methylthioadenosine nucleosidase [Sphingomonas sp. Leaf11]
MAMQATRIGGRRVLFIMATGHEYGPCLAERFVPVITGVGPVEAAVGTAQALAGMDALPDLIVSIGSAGSRTLPLGSVWQVASVSWRDMDASRIGFAKGVVPFADFGAVLPLNTPLDWPVARLSTGADIVGGDDYADIDADMVDMETYAVVRACARFGVPVMGLRGISDGPGELEAIGGWTAMLGVLDEKLAGVVDRLG